MTWQIYYLAVIGQVSRRLGIKKEYAKMQVDSHISDVKDAFNASPQIPTAVIAKKVSG